MKKAILLLAMLSLFMNVASAQCPPPRAPSPEAIQAMQDDVYKNAPLVFEGKELKHEYRGGNWTHLVSLVQVTTAYRGDLKAGDIVELWYADGRKFENGAPVNRNIDDCFDDGYENSNLPMVYYMCSYTDTPHAFSTEQHSGKKCLTYYKTRPTVSRVSFYINENGIDTMAIGLGVYSLININEYKLNTINKYFKPQKNTAKLKLSNTKKSKRKHRVGSNQKVASVGLELWATNQTVSGGYYEYDMMAQAASATYVNNISFYINFNPFYFCNTTSGCNAITDLVSATLDPTFQGTILAGGQQRAKYTNDVSWQVYQQKVFVNLHVTDYTSFGSNIPYARPLLSTTPQRLMHIKMRLKDASLTCVPNAGTLETGLNSNFTNTANAAYSPPSDAYAVTFRNGAVFRMNTPCAAPTISYITPKLLNAGVGDILTIYGDNFGATQNVGYIGFRNANKPYKPNGDNNYIDAIDPTDVVFWSNTKIQVRIPSLYAILKRAAGSGRIQVFNSSGISRTSDTAVHIAYSFINDTATYPLLGNKDYMRLVNKNCRRSFLVRCHKNVPLTMQKQTIAALNAWNIKLGYNIFTIDPNPMSSLYHPDTCVIRMNETDTASFVMRTTIKGAPLRNTLLNDPTAYRQINNGFDIRLATKFSDFTPYVFFYDSTGTQAKPVNTTDFYGDILHEIGHGLGLGHALDITDVSVLGIDSELMSPFSYDAAQSIAQRKNLTSSGGESLLGAQSMLARSQATVWSKGGDPLVGTIGVPIPPITVFSAITTLCGYKQGRELITLATGANYQWQNQPPSGGQFVDIPTNDPNFIGSQTNQLKFNYNTAFDPNGYSIRCNINNNGCGLVGGIDAATATLRTITTGQMPVLQPIPARCKAGVMAFTPVSTPSTPSGGTYSLYTMAGVLVPNAIVNPLGSQINGSAVGFGKYQLRYTVTNACGTVYDSKTLTLVSCNGIQPRINTLYKDATNYTDINSFCLNSPTAGAFSLSYTVLGIAAAGDSIKVQLSNAAGVFPAITKNSSFIAKKLAVAGSNKTDIITSTVPYPSTPAGSAYKMRLLHKNTAATPAIVYDTIGYTITMAVSATLGGPCAALDPNNNKAQGRINTHTDGDKPLTPVTAISIYPNPSTGIFTVALPDTDGEATTNIIEVLDINGRLLLTANTTTPQTELNLSNYATGIYLVRVHWHGEVTTHKVVISE